MDETLPDDKAITAPVPIVYMAVEDQYKSVQAADLTHFVVQLSYKRLDSIMQAVVGISYDFNKPWPFWFFIGKIVSKAFFDNEEQLEWLNSVQVGNREFIAFSNTGRKFPDQEEQSTGKGKLRVVEIDLSKPQPGEKLQMFWKPARSIICQKVQGWLDYASNEGCA
ncbi:hypothetical protein P170DRAFT_481240 [Aspergillus steynii IBT 23096]|uniref:Uncharacterized protein n=1 Tax=Aspergillus steynii IBT 23096 TaxID=1392250 RepID=A0A2I2FRQ2_9EURO|nr:uncharacterized protein P170DRAFT_481240 [Aspergillus steynii IBT 23096]PLB43291.1 hypothetical protein P170DRAFT_481240 [Aspergillus steynii IBT 23096]